MIDRLVIHIPFFSEHVTNFQDETSILDVSKLFETELSLAARSVEIENDGSIKVEELTHPWESIPSWASGMAVKAFTRPVKSRAYVEIKASPAKLLLGHNVFGTDDYEKCVIEMLALLKLSFPKLFAMLDVDDAYLSSFDVTYSARAETQQIADTFLKYCSSIARGQTKSSEQFTSTVYFGKRNSRHKNLKIYLKYYELKNYVEQLKKKNSDSTYDEAIAINSSEELIEYTRGLIRFEATIKKRWLLDRQIPVSIKSFSKHAKKYSQENKKSFFKQIHKEAFKDVFKSFEGAEIMNYSDENILQLLKNKHSKIRKDGTINHNISLRAFRFYRSIASEGFTEVKATTSESTFYRQLKQLRDAGISIAHIQNLHKIKSNLVPIIQLVKLDYENQHPANYQEPKSALTKPRLALVS